MERKSYVEESVERREILKVWNERERKKGWQEWIKGIKKRAGIDMSVWKTINDRGKEIWNLREWGGKAQGGKISKRLKVYV